MNTLDIECILAFSDAGYSLLGISIALGINRCVLGQYVTDFLYNGTGICPVRYGEGGPWFDQYVLTLLKTRVV